MKATNFVNYRSVNQLCHKAVHAGSRSTIRMPLDAEGIIHDSEIIGLRPPIEIVSFCLEQLLDLAFLVIKDKDLNNELNHVLIKHRKYQEAIRKSTIESEKKSDEAFYAIFEAFKRQQSPNLLNRP